MEHHMDSDQIFAAIESIAKTPGKNDKIGMVKALIGCDEFKRVMVAALDPLTSYGVKKLPTDYLPSAAGGRTFNATTWGVLQDLAKRSLSGNAAQDAIGIELSSLTPASAELFRRIMLKDLRAGFGAETVNKAAPGTIEDFPYMRCCLPKDTKLDKFDWSTGVFSQEKADGMFANVDHEESGEVFLSSRAGSMFPMEQFESLAAAVRVVFPPGTQSHGELLVLRDGMVCAREIGNGILNSVLKGGAFADNERPMFMAWDQIPLSVVAPKGKYATPYRERFKRLLLQLQANQSGVIRLVPTKIVKSLTDAYRHYAELLAQGKEGTIIKNPSAVWRDGTSKEQVKLKLEFVVDLEVIGFEPGNGKNAATFGSLITQTGDGLLKVSVSGISDKLRAEIHADRDGWMNTIISVKANGIMKPSADGKLHSLFLPRYVERRLDKTRADSLEWVFAQEDAAKQGAAVLKQAA